MPAVMLNLPLALHKCGRVPLTTGQLWGHDGNRLEYPRPSNDIKVLPSWILLCLAKCKSSNNAAHLRPRHCVDCGKLSTWGP